MKKKSKKIIYLFQPQWGATVTDFFTYYLPYSVGCLWSYVSQFEVIKQNFTLIDFIFKRENPQTLVQGMVKPDICGFSCYSWNEKYCLYIAELIKQQYPACTIVFGGPQTKKSYLLYPFVDCVITGEGEECFYDLLIDAVNKKPIKTFYDKKRLTNLNIPSPYTSGIFDKLIKNNPDIIWSAVFETNRGCPYSCTFCDWGSVTQSKVNRFDLGKIKEELDWMKSNPIGYINCADANFGIFKERDLEIAKMMREASDNSMIDAILLNYAKHSSEIVFEIAKIIGKYGRGVTMSVQSTHKDTLVAIKRVNMKINNIKHLMQLSRQYEVPVYTEVILGLPEETLDSFKQGMCDIIEMGQHNTVDISFTQLFANSELSSPESVQKYGIKSIRAKDYHGSYINEDYYDIDETIELVQSTNTMSTEEIVEAYLYGWMIVHVHNGGYSQVISTFLRQQNITWQVFYDKLFKNMQSHDIFSDHMTELKNILLHYFYTGDLVFPTTSKTKFDTTFKKGVSSGGHSIHVASYEHIKKSKDSLIELVIDTASEILPIPEYIKIIQKNFIFDKNCSYPIYVKDNKDRLISISSRMDSNVTYSSSNINRYSLFKNIVNYVDNSFDTCNNVLDY